MKTERHDSAYGFDPDIHFGADGKSWFGSNAERDSASGGYDGVRWNRGGYTGYADCGGYDGWTNYEEYSEDYDNF